MQITKMFLTKGRGGRPGIVINPKGVVIHWTANTNLGADADNNRNYFENHPQNKVAAHYVVDDHQIVQCVPENEMAYHVGAITYTKDALQKLSSYPNNCTIGIEMCVNSDGDFNKTYRNTVLLAADILKHYGWGVDKLWRHYDVTNKDCPKFFVHDDAAGKYGINGGATAGWEGFKRKVEEAMTVSQWKLDVMDEALQEGLILGEHHPDDVASKWFVLVVALNILKVVKKWKVV